MADVGHVSHTLGWFKLSCAALFIARFAIRPGAVLRCGVDVQLVTSSDLIAMSSNVLGLFVSIALGSVCDYPRSYPF